MFIFFMSLDYTEAGLVFKSSLFEVGCAGGLLVLLCTILKSFD